MRLSRLGPVGVAAVLSLGPVRGASAQTPPPQVNEHCTVSVLNRTVTANPDGTWILPNVPANFGPVRARVTCIVNGQTISGESDPFTVPANGAVNIPQIHFGQTRPIPTAVTIAPPAVPLTQAGQTLQLTVTALYPDSSTSDVTPGSAGTTYTVSNPAIATISSDGLLQAVSSGTVIVQATNEGASGMRAFQVAFAGTDTDGDGIPDDVELALGMNPNNPVDAQEDFDRDNLTNLQEYQLGTDLRKVDTDGDGLRDGDEVARGTGPLIADTDGDGISDGLEVQTGSNPLDANSYNLAGALNTVAVTPVVFTLTFNTIAGDASVQLRVTGTLRDGSMLDLTSTQRGTIYASNDLSVCNFGGDPGRVFAGASGGCTVTATVGGFSASAIGTVTTFAPTPLSSVSLGGPGNGVDVSGDFVYVAAGPAGLKVVDVANRSAPRVAATLSLLGSANDVKVDGLLAYVAAGAAGLHVVDITNPFVPRLLGSVDTPGDGLDVRARGNLAFVADGIAGLQVIDVTNASTPRIVGNVATGPGATGVDVDDMLAVVTTGSAGVRIVNVADPANPFVVGTVDTPGEARDVVVNAGLAYVADYTGSLRAVDYRNPAAPLLAGTTTQALGGILLDVARMDTFVFGADIFFVNGVPIVDVSDADNLRPRAILIFPGDATGLGIAVDGSYIYLGTDTNQLYVGQYRVQQDLNGVPPTVRIASPTNGATFVEGETITVTVTAADDLAVAHVALLVDGMTVATDTTAPYQFNVAARTGAAVMLTLGATAGDLGSNNGIAADVVVNVIPDPLTTAVGRVVLENGTPVSSASIACLTRTSLTLVDGTFSITDIPTVQPTVSCTASFVTDAATTLHGTSAMLLAVRGGVTLVGDVVIAPVPVITSLSGRAAVFNSTIAVVVEGTNLTSALFSFGTSAIAVTAAIVNPEGTSARLTVSVGTMAGTFAFVATNAFGASTSAVTQANHFTVVDPNSTADFDGDGVPDAIEAALGSDPLDSAMVPNVNRPSSGEVNAPIVSVLNSGGALTGQPTVAEADAVPFSALNIAGITGGLPVQMEVNSRVFSILNSDVSAPPGAQADGGGGGGGGQPVQMEADAIPFTVNNTAPGAPLGALQAGLNPGGNAPAGAPAQDGRAALVATRPLTRIPGILINIPQPGTYFDVRDSQPRRRRP